MGKLGDFAESLSEVLWIAKNTITTFWFWVPIIYMGYVLLQLWAMFYIHPLTLAILPAVLIVYGVRLENKRFKLRFGLGKSKRMTANRGLGGELEPVKEFEWKVEQAVEQYEQLLKEEEANHKE